jgi:hypothetical protein
MPGYPMPPGFIPPPFNWFQFAMLYIAFLEAVILALPQRRQTHLLRVLFCTKGISQFLICTPP